MASSFVMRDCKLPASWSGTFVTGTLRTGTPFDFINCDSGTTNSRIQSTCYAGDTKTETTIVRTGGANDGTNGLAWKMASNSTLKWPAIPLYSPEIAQWVDTTGSSKTATVEILHFAQGSGTNGALKDSEIHLELEYLGTASSAAGQWDVSDRGSAVLSAADQTASSESWDSLATAYNTGTNYAIPALVKPTTPNGAIYSLKTDAGTTAAEPTWGTTDGADTTDAAGRAWTRCNRQKLSAAVTPQVKGWFVARVVLTVASKTVYVCPKLVIS
jgi:hypothetical protein